jgi:hypothetical protein
VGLSPRAAGQDDYSDKPFGVRLRPAFLRFIEVSSAGGASAANRWSAAVNPASADWNDVPSPRGLILAPYYSHIAFDEGTRLHLAGESFTWDLGELGTVLPSVVQIRSNEARDAMGLEFDYRVDYAQVQWAKRCGDWGFGLTASVGKAEIQQDLGPLRVADTEADTYRFRAGLLHQPAERWLTGCIVEYGFSPYETDALALTPLGPVAVEIDGTERGFLVRPGVSYEYADYSCLYADYQYGRYSNRGDHLRSHWWVVGVDHRLLEWLWVRGSASIDGRGNASGSCGLGAYFSRRCSVDIGYQYDPLPELQPEFGRSHILQLAFSARF